jgi:sialate O-acetylesterase
MVLQRHAPVHIWRWSAPGEEVSVAFHEQHATTRSDEIGKWSLYLGSESAGGPYQLTVRSNNTVTLSNILVGNVWLTSGQSNMEIPLKGFPATMVKDSAKTIASANHPEIRLLRLETKASTYPPNDISATWTACTPQTAADFSVLPISSAATYRTTRMCQWD